MTSHEKFAEIKKLLDELIDEFTMEGTLQHSDVVTAVDGLQREINRKNLVEGIGNGKGAM